MIITRTPFRISFFGGGSDYPAWFTQHGGAVLGATIDKYCWLTVRKSPPFGKPYKIVYAKTEESDCIGDIAHPAVRETLTYMGYPERLEVYHTSDLPARSGMGSSSAFVVGLVKAIAAMHPEKWNQWDVAESAIWIEQNILKETVGSQDQILCSYGGMNIIDFPKQGEPSVYYTFLDGFDAKHCARILEQRLLLFYTGVQRTASDVASAYVPKLVGDYEAATKQLMGMVNEGAQILRGIARGENPDAFGYLLDRAWQVKKQLKGVTTPEIEAVDKRAYDAGALGLKVLGAGGGGFVLLYVPSDKQAAVREALKDLKETPFHFEWEGSKVVYNSALQGEAA